MVTLTRTYSAVRLIRESFQKQNEIVSLDRVAAPIEDRVPVAEAGRQVTPWRAGAYDPRYRYDRQPVATATALGIAHFAETMCLYLRPKRVGEYQSFQPKIGRICARNGIPLELAFPATALDLAPYRFVGDNLSFPIAVPQVSSLRTVDSVPHGNQVCSL